MARNYSGYRSRQPLYNRFHSVRSLGNTIDRGVRAVGRYAGGSAVAGLANMAARAAQRRSQNRTAGLFGSGSRFRSVNDGSRFRVVNNGIASARRRIGKRQYIKSKVGKYVRKRMKSGMNVYDKLGSSIIVETPTVYDAQTDSSLFVGHGAAMDYFWASIGRALIRKLYESVGEGIEDWNKPPLGYQKRNIQTWYSRVNEASGYLSFDVLTAASYDQQAQNWVSTVKGLFAATDSNIQLYKMFLFGADGTYGTADASIDLTRLVVNYSINSRLTIQNVSLAGNSTAATTDDDLTTAITDNPLRGKVYQTMYRATGFRLETGPNTSATATSLNADNQYGLIRFKPRNTAGVDQTLAPYIRRVPAGKFFNAKAHNVSMRAGEIKTFSWKDVRSIKFQKLIDELKNSFTDTNNYFQRVGYAQCVGLEKMLNVADGGAEFPIKVHAKVQQVYACYVSQTHSVTPRLVSINGTVV